MTCWGKVFAVSLLCVPGGAVLLREGLINGVQFSPSSLLSINWPFLLGLFFSFAPLIIVLVHWLGLRP